MKDIHHHRELKLNTQSAYYFMPHCPVGHHSNSISSPDHFLLLIVSAIECNCNKTVRACLHQSSNTVYIENPYPAAIRIPCQGHNSITEMAVMEILRDKHTHSRLYDKQLWKCQWWKNTSSHNTLLALLPSCDSYWDSLIFGITWTVVMFFVLQINILNLVFLQMLHIYEIAAVRIGFPSTILCATTSSENHFMY